MKRTLAILVLTAAAGLPLPAAAQGPKMPEYEPSRRQRTALDTCMKTEVMREAWCVKKCAADFRMESSGSNPRCIGTKPDAKVPPPPEPYKPPARNPNARPVPGT